MQQRLHVELWEENLGAVVVALSCDGRARDVNLKKRGSCKAYTGFGR